MATFPSALNVGATTTVSGLEAILFSSSRDAPLLTPKAYTMTPLSFSPRDASSRGVYCFVVVCWPSVMTSATCNRREEDENENENRSQDNNEKEDGKEDKNKKEDENVDEYECNNDEDENGDGMRNCKRQKR